MRILILGGQGMLGHQLLLSLRSRHEVRTTLHHEFANNIAPGLFTAENTYPNIDVRSDQKINQVLDHFRPDAVINAVGIIKQRDNANVAIPSIEINALLPHRLSKHCKNTGARLIQPSTDCIFSGDRGNYTEDDFPDARDLYGRSKVLGEVSEPHCITLRTSIVGLELRHNKSLIEWFLAQKGKISGYRSAIYTGVTTLEFARVIERILTEYSHLSGVYQLASTPIDKYTLLTTLAEKLRRRDISIEADDTFICNRSLNGTRFASAIRYQVPSWDTMLEELARQILSRKENSNYDFCE